MHICKDFRLNWSLLKPTCRCTCRYMYQVGTFCSALRWTVATCQRVLNNFWQPFDDFCFNFQSKYKKGRRQRWWLLESGHGNWQLYLPQVLHFNRQMQMKPIRKPRGGEGVLKHFSIQEGYAQGPKPVPFYYHRKYKIPLSQSFSVSSVNGMTHSTMMPW